MKDRRKTDREKENSTGKKFLLEESAFPSNPASTHSRYPSSMELQTPATVLVRVRDSSQSGFNVVYAPAGLHRLSFPIPERYGHPTPNPDSRWLDQPSTGYPKEGTLDRASHQSKGNTGGGDQFSNYSKRKIL